MKLVLHGYYRSTAAWRVRIALALKMLPSDAVFHHLRRGEQREAAYLRINPQGLLPSLEVDGAPLTQSLAIIEWLNETVPAPPLLPPDPMSRARVRAFALAIACDIHPVQNLRILGRLRALNLSESEVTGWAKDVIADGLDACEALLESQTGPFCFGATPSVADLCLIPQLFNARRFGISPKWPKLLAAEAACSEVPAFQSAEADRQSDAET